MHDPRTMYPDTWNELVGESNANDTGQNMYEYAKCIEINSIPELQWYLFCKHMTESNRLPPTQRALKHHILRVHIQASIWGQASIAQQELFDPLQNGFCKAATGDLSPHTTGELPAPTTIVGMVNWLIATVRETARHKCVAVDHTTYIALNSVCAAPCAKTTMITTVIQYLTRAQIR